MLSHSCNCCFFQVLFRPSGPDVPPDVHHPDSLHGGHLQRNRILQQDQPRQPHVGQRDQPAEVQM
jgi:hypothetical protein